MTPKSIQELTGLTLRPHTPTAQGAHAQWLTASVVIDGKLDDHTETLLLSPLDVYRGEFVDISGIGFSQFLKFRFLRFRPCSTT